MVGMQAMPAHLEGIKGMFLYSMEKDDDSGYLTIRPMNGEDCITIHGAEKAKFFTSQIMGHYQTT